MTSLEKKRISPLARRLAREKGINIDNISGTGPRGRVIARDILNHDAKATNILPVSNLVSNNEGPRVFYEPGSYDELPLNNMRRAIATRLTEAKQTIPHIYLSIDCELDALLQLRTQLNAHLKKQGSDNKVSVNDFIVKCAGVALMRVPDVNVSFAGTHILRHKSADISVAVAIDNGLITPIVRRAHEKKLVDISQEIKSLATRAKNKQLKPQEYEGGSFSISNMGMFGINTFSAIINPPQAAILAVGKGEERVIVRNGQMVVATIMTVTLSCDHRAIDGALGAQFLSEFKSLVEFPGLMI